MQVTLDCTSLPNLKLFPNVKATLCFLEKSATYIFNECLRKKNTVLLKTKLIHLTFQC